MMMIRGDDEEWPPKVRLYSRPDVRTVSPLYRTIVSLRSAFKTTSIDDTKSACFDMQNSPELVEGKKKGFLAASCD